MRVHYFSIKEMLDMIDEPTRSLCARLLSENRDLFRNTPGSSHNHQVWKGGYLNHIEECMNVGIVLYHLFQSIRPFLFSLSDVMVVLFLHDIEKPWLYRKGADRKILKTKRDRGVFRNYKLKEYRIKLTSEQKNAMKYIEGEFDDYTSLHRTMRPLAAFCHLADITSARIWFSHPLRKNDPWRGARRYK